MDPKTITHQLHRRPTRAWKVGEARRTLTGTPLPGIYSETYWYVKLTRGGIVWSKGAGVEEYLERAWVRLNQHGPFFRRVRSGGGRAELFIGIFGQKNWGFELGSSLLSRFGRIGLS